MHQIQCNYQSMVSPWKGQISKPTSQAVQVANAQVTLASTSQNMVLSLTTNEGDKISLSLAARTQSDYLNYLETGQEKQGDYAHQLQMFSTASEQDFTMTVEGDLNEQERKDIGAVLKTIDKMMANFVQGRLEPMVAKANKLSQLDTISSLSLEMSYTREVMVAQQIEVQRVPDPLGTYDSQGQLTDTPPAIARPLPESTQLRSQVTAEANDLSTVMAKQLAQVREFSDRLHGAVKQIFDKYRQRIEKLNPDNVSGTALIDRMHKDLLSKMLKEHIAQTQGEDAATVA
jgi:DnaJ-domain-containing protein 1